MNLLRRILICIVIAASVTIPFLLYRSVQSKLRAKEQVIQQQTGLLTELEAANSKLAARPRPAENPTGLSEADQRELLRLRHEAGVLRRLTNALPQALVENRQLRDRVAAAKASLGALAPTSPPVALPRESWNFAGYATPEAGFQTFIWSMSLGDPKAVIASMTEKAAADYAETLARYEDYAASNARRMAGMAGIQVRREAVSEDEMLMEISVVADGVTNKGKILRMKKVGNEWKIDEKY